MSDAVNDSGVKTGQGTHSLLALTVPERGIVVFRLFPKLAYRARMGLALALVAIGLLLQASTLSFWPGAALLLLGSLVLVVRGYHNRVEAGAFDPAANWETVERDKLKQLLKLDKKMLRWNQSWMDVTNTRGMISLALIVAPVGFLIYYRMEYGERFLPIEFELLLFDALILFLPHWVTGIRSILRQPKLIVKVDTLMALLKRGTDLLRGEDVVVMMLLKGSERIPEDVKLRIPIAGADPDFLGVYVQVVTNDVKGTSYPYAYCVLVARDGFGLMDRSQPYAPPDGIVKETKRQDGMEIVVLRQRTTETTGYHTDTTAAHSILDEAVKLARVQTGATAPQPEQGHRPLS